MKIQLPGTYSAHQRTLHFIEEYTNKKINFIRIKNENGISFNKKTMWIAHVHLYSFRKTLKKDKFIKINIL